MLMVMNRLLWQKVAPILAGTPQAVLATCGERGPFASTVSLHLQGEHLYLCLANASEHLFNLQSQPQVVLLSPQWELHGRGEIEAESGFISPIPWQVTIRLRPTCLHILSAQGTHYVETIDLQG